LTFCKLFDIIIYFFIIFCISLQRLSSRQKCNLLHSCLFRLFQPNSLALRLYDSVYLYMIIADKMLRNGYSAADIANGTLVFQQAISTQFSGKYTVAYTDKTSPRHIASRCSHTPCTGYFILSSATLSFFLLSRDVTSRTCPKMTSHARASDAKYLEWRLSCRIDTFANCHAERQR
jgi:hypothetical protein